MIITEAPNLNKKTAKILADIDKKCFEKDAYSEQDWMKTFNPDVSVLFAMEKEKVVGAAVWEIYREARTGYLISNAVLPEYRGKRYGTHLLWSRINKAEALGVKYLFAHTRASNESSQHLLLTAGFKPVSIEHNYYPDEPAIQWKLKL